MAQPPNFSHYVIYRSVNSGPFSSVGTSTSPSYSDTSVAEGNTYCYYIVSVDTYGNETLNSPSSCVFFSTSQGLAGAPIGPENVVVVYREGDSESQEFAQRYQQIHGLSDAQLLAVPCSAIEVLNDFDTFREEVETPISEALVNEPLSNYTVYAFVLMPRVPGGFHHEDDVVSSTSRLSRIGHAFSKKILNPLYDRKTFKRFDGDDLEVARICTRFDSPTGAITRQWFDNTETAVSQLFTTGKFYLDPYSAFRGHGSSRYEQELLFFHDSLLQRLGLEVFTSFQVDPYIDAFIPAVQEDSFFWGWGADRGSLSYFRTTTALRGFFYNGDFDGAVSMRDVDARTWPLLAIRQGYVATAGAMSDPTIDGFMRPTPFFDAMFRGATLGEAMLFSVPHLDWTMAFFGDPLLKFNFPTNFNEEVRINFDLAWQTMADCTAQSIVNIYRKTQLAQSLLDYVVGGHDLESIADLLQPTTDLRNINNSTSWKNDYVALSKALFNTVTIRNQTAYERHFPDLAYYLSQTSNKVTEIVLDTLQNEAVKNSISAANIEEEGTWDLTFDLEHTPGTFAFYHFELEVSTTADFADILISRDSFQSLVGWYYEDSEGNYQSLGANGLTSNYAGKNVRYISQDGENLERGSYYFFRIRQKDQLTTFPARDFRQVIYR
jgi:uncharacterized protein (TIGR03790 family)